MCGDPIRSHLHDEVEELEDVEETSEEEKKEGLGLRTKVGT